MIIVFTGDGKGKTTAAIGQAVRVVGRGRRVYMMQFIKSHGYPSGEDRSIPERFGRDFRFFKGGKGFVGILGDKLPRKTHKDAAGKAFEKAEKALSSGRYDLVILDEIIVALGLRLLTKKRVLEVFSKIPEDTDVIFTGRRAPKWLIGKADLVTELKNVKHPYNEGERARKGLEY